MSTTDGGGVRAQRGSEDIKQPKAERPAFFPLGYKDAAYQWVSHAPEASKQTSPRFANMLLL